MKQHPEFGFAFGGWVGWFVSFVFNSPYHLGCLLFMHLSLAYCCSPPSLEIEVLTHIDFGSLSAKHSYCPEQCSVNLFLSKINKVDTGLNPAMAKERVIWMKTCAVRMHLLPILNHLQNLEMCCFEV